MRRRWWLKATMVGALGFLPWNRLAAQQGNGGSTNGANFLTPSQITPLKDQLEKGLRATTPAQKQFVATVVNAVENNHIPRAMVNLVFRWALERNKRVPFPYFEFALRALAKRRGIIFP